MGVKKRTRKTKSSNKMYFSQETEDAIVRYNQTTDPDERERIFKEDIAYPLDKMAENIINRFKFPYVNQTFEDLKKQVVSFLVMTVEKDTPDKGKAFSYFSVIAKNYLILHNTNGYKHEKRSVYLSDKTESDVPIEEILQLDGPNFEEHDEAKEFVRLMVEYWENNVTRVFKKKRDIDIANAIIELFRRAETIENFNKKALYLMIREMTDCKTSYITKVVNKMRKHVVEHMNEYKDTGVIEQTQSKFFTYN
jgi:hypothetical protein